MKKVATIFAGLFATLYGTTSFLAVPFINLDFEGVSSNAIGAIQPAIRDVMPGWLLNGSSDNGINFNFDCDEGCAGFFSLEAFADASSFIWRYFPSGLHGNYGVGLAPKPDLPLIVLSQRGDVPLGAKYLAMDAQVSLSGNVVAYLDGARVTVQAINVTNATDISALAGKNVNLEIKFGAFAQNPGPSMPLATVGLDAVVFIIPPQIDPATLALGTNGFTLSWTNDVSTRYQVESATNFPAKWQPIGAPVGSTNGNFTFTDTTATNLSIGQRFYRLRLAP